ncbi:hypothetical protein [Rhizobium paknamense]|uniref:Mobilization protein n=1 Tax=Rhizobium paknamense TaxID=1206817 RepID=A0ABU0IGX9_9HYPH|nr:hypothetical protein [Rhizobium paknamense]MDQ0457421.1 hypothetical protein [Rhizobium paknamense]
MGYQFAHLESFSRKPDAQGRGVDFVFAEASRKPEASVHVKNPMPPIVVYGLDVKATQELHDSVVASATVQVKGGKTRKVRLDQKTLYTVVASHPHRMEEIRADPAKKAEAEIWEKRTVAWLRSQYGDDLISVVRHEDEAYFHVHAYVIPLSDPGLKAQQYHPGVTIKRSIMSAGPAEGENQKALRKRADAAYKSAMRAWQDSYYDAVAAPCGLARLGPRRRRLSRAEWQQEKAQAKALQNTNRRAQEVRKAGQAFINSTRAKAAEIAASANRERDAAQRMTIDALAAQDRAIEEREQARALTATAIRYSGWAGKLRAAWDGIRHSRIAEMVRAELASEIDRWREAAKEADRKRLDAERRKHEAEQKARAAQDAAMRLGIERDRLRLTLSYDADQRAPELSLAPTPVLKPQFGKNRKV